MCTSVPHVPCAPCMGSRVAVNILKLEKRAFRTRIGLHMGRCPLGEIIDGIRWGVQGFGVGRPNKYPPPIAGGGAVGVDGPAPGSTTTHSFSPSPSLSSSLSLLTSLSHLSLSSPLFSPPHAGPQWVIWLEYRGSTKCKYTCKYGEEYRETKTYDDPYQHVCAPSNPTTLCSTPSTLCSITHAAYVCGIGMYVLSDPSNRNQNGKKTYLLLYTFQFCIC